MEERLAKILRETKRVILPVICGNVFPETTVYLSLREKGEPNETDKEMSISNLLESLGLIEFQIKDAICLYEHFRPAAGQNLADFLGKKVEVWRSHPAVIGVCDVASYEPQPVGCCPS